MCIHILGGWKDAWSLLEWTTVHIWKERRPGTKLAYWRFNFTCRNWGDTFFSLMSFICPQLYVCACAEKILNVEYETQDTNQKIVIWYNQISKRKKWEKWRMKLTFSLAKWSKQTKAIGTLMLLAIKLGTETGSFLITSLKYWVWSILSAVSKAVLGDSEFCSTFS